MLGMGSMSATSLCGGRDPDAGTDVLLCSLGSDLADPSPAHPSPCHGNGNGNWNACHAWVAGLAPPQLRRAARWFRFLLPVGFVLIFLSVSCAFPEHMAGFQALFPTLELCCSTSQGKKNDETFPSSCRGGISWCFFCFWPFFFFNWGGRLLISIENLLLCGKHSL